MPNHISNKIEFSCNEELAQKILSEISGENGAVDFNSLIPTPVHIYQGDLKGDDKNDFQEHNCWTNWNLANWGTKWNAHEFDIKNQDGAVSIYFETAWGAPFPFIIAFAQKYKLSFTHKYFDEAGNFWGVDTWENGIRIIRNRDNQEIYHQLSIELMGYDREEEQ